jgi:hypothetical protein
MGKHPNFKRANITFEIENRTDGYYIKIIDKNIGPHFIQVPFETEELAGRAGQALLDYAYGTPRQMTRGDSRTSKGTGMKSQAERDLERGAAIMAGTPEGERLNERLNEMSSDKPATRKAPKKRQNADATTSAAPLEE